MPTSTDNARLVAYARLASKIFPAAFEKDHHPNFYQYIVKMFFDLFFMGELLKFYIYIYRCDCLSKAHNAIYKFSRNSAVD